MLRIRVVYAGSRILNPVSRSQQQQLKRRGKLLLSYLFFVTNITELEIILCLKWKRKKIVPVYKSTYFLPKKSSPSSHKMDLGSEIRDPRSGIHGSKGAPDPTSGYATLVFLTELQYFLGTSVGALSYLCTIMDPYPVSVRTFLRKVNS